MSKEESLNFSNKKSESVSNIDILKQLEILDSENIQLKEALSDLEKDLRDKDQSIEESQKIITKLKEEYTKVIKELQRMEKSYNELLEEVSRNSEEVKNAQKNQSLLDMLQKKNDYLSNEKNNLHKENIIMRKKIMSCGNISIKNEKDMKNKDLMIENLQKKNTSYIKMLKERDVLIEEQSKKIKELNGIINNKNEELKIMMNISKEINKENKISFKELTKQAVNTIITFKNNIGNNKNRNNSVDYNSRISLNNSKTFFDDFESVFKKNKATFILEDAINGVLFIPDNIKRISKEFLINMNLKTELIKNELFSGLIRESKFVNFLQKIFQKIYIKDNNGFFNVFQNIAELKKKYLYAIKENNKMKKVISIINNKHFSDIQKIKENVYKNNKLIKNKFIEKEMELQKLKNELKSLNNIIINNSIQNNSSIKTLKHVSFNNFKNRVNSYGEYLSPKIWNTLPSWEGADETNIVNTSREINYKDSFIKSSKISSKQIFPRKKAYKKLLNNTDSINIYETNFHNKSLEFNSSPQVENNKSQDLIYLQHKIESKKDLKKNNNYSYKKDILNLQNEFNNILLKSVKQKSINLIDNKNKSPSPSPIYMKIDNTINNKKNKKIIKEIFSGKPREKKICMPYLSSHNIINNQRSLIWQRNGRDFSNAAYKNVSVTENNNNMNMNFNGKRRNNNFIFNVDFFMNFFLKINVNIFDIFDLTRYKKIYNLSNIENIYLSFQQRCNELKNKTDETNLKINKSHYLTNDKFNDKNNVKIERKEFIDNSFKFFNERIINLKKFEFEFINMNEYIKNYLVSQEKTVKIMYNMGKKHLKFEPIEKLFNLFEDCLSYRIDEMNENIIFNRKLLIKLFKNQINCLFLSFEYKFH